MFVRGGGHTGGRGRHQRYANRTSFRSSSAPSQRELVTLNQESEECIPEEPLSVHSEPPLCQESDDVEPSVDLINPLPVDVLYSVEGAHSTSKRDSAGNLLSSGDEEDIRRKRGLTYTITDTPYREDPSRSKTQSKQLKKKADEVASALLHSLNEEVQGIDDHPNRAKHCKAFQFQDCEFMSEVGQVE